MSAQNPDDDAFGPTLVPSDAGPVSVDRVVDPALAPTMHGPSAGPGGDASKLTAEDPGRYRRGDEIGRGGMGCVVIAFDEHLGREVAMKELLVQQGGDSSAGLSVGVVTRFLREARVTGQLEHPSIVPVHELGQRADGALYYTMKRIRGRSLASVLRECRSVEDRLEHLIHFRKVCEAMAYAHSRGVVHRDLKPDNIMVGEFGETLIVDWGLAKVRGQDDPRAADIERRMERVSMIDSASSTLDGHALGTPAYMSPEQARGELAQIDERSDVWGLGAILFEILTGRPPHTGERAVEVLQKVLTERPPKVLEVESGAPAELAAIADRALLLDRSSRYPGAEALAAEIAAFQDGGQVHAYEYSSLDMVRRFVGRHRAASVAVLTVALAIVTATLLAYSGYRSEREARSLAEARSEEAVGRRELAETRQRELRVSLAEALLERAEAALDAGDPAAAAIYATGALLRDPANPASPEHAELTQGSDERRAARERVARAFSAYLDAEDARRFVFVRRVDGVSARGGLSPDGRSLVFPAGRELAIEPAIGGERRRIAIRAQSVLAFLDTPLDPERVVLSGDAPGVYSLTSGERLFALPDGTRAASANGDRLAVALEDGTVLVYASEGYAELGAFSASVPGAPDLAWVGEAIVVGGRGSSRAELWPWPPGERLASVELTAISHALAVAPDGSRIAAGFAEPSLAWLDPVTLAVNRSVSVDGPVSDVAWFGERHVASAEGRDRIVVRNVETMARLETLHVPTALGHSVQSGGRRGLLVALPFQDSSRLVRASVFRFERHRERRARTLPGVVMDVLVDLPRRRLVVATSRALASVSLIRDGLGEPGLLASLPPEVGHPLRLALAADGTIAAVTDLGAVLLHAPHAAEASVLIEPSERVPCALGLAFGPGDDVVFAGSASGAIRRWHRSRAEPLTPLEGHDGAVCGLDLGHDGATLASASRDGSVRLWDARDGTARRTFARQNASFSDLRFAADGARVVTANALGDVIVMRVVDGREEARFRAGEGWVERLAWSPDGLHILAAGADRTVRYYSDDGTRLLRVVRTRGLVRAVAFSPRGDQLFFTDARTVVRLPASPAVDARDPEALLRLAESRAGLRLEGLELVPN